MLVGILSNEDPQSSQKWELACKSNNIQYKTINLTKSDWFRQVTSETIDFFLLKPPGEIERYKNLYDERIYIINKILNKPTFPSYEEAFIYENKKLLSYFLKATEIPHPKTHVFYQREEAFNFLESAKFPLVGKSSIGASGSGVVIFRNKSKANQYVKKAFSQKGIIRRFGPNRVTGTPGKWFKKALQNPQYFLKKIKEYISIYRDGQTGYLLFQDFIPHDFEWRAVKIGESYFAHKKIKLGDKASGSKGIDYVNPPIKLLDFVRDLCDTHNFNFMAIDLFENGKGGYLVNELQTIFGHVQDHILEVHGQPGRYLHKNEQWVFEEGDFNTNESFDLRLECAIKSIDKSS